LIDFFLPSEIAMAAAFARAVLYSLGIENMETWRLGLGCEFMGKVL
jgi:hypothetical protein